MQTDKLWRKIAVVVALVFGLATASWAGHHQTNPKHHIHCIWDLTKTPASPICFEAKLRIGWRGKENVLDQVKYELNNMDKSNSTYYVKGVRIVDKSTDNVLWSASDNKAIKGGKKEKHEWRGNYMHDKGISRSNIRMEILLWAPSQYWVLTWDPEASGKASTSVTEGNWD